MRVMKTNGRSGDQNELVSYILAVILVIKYIFILKDPFLKFTRFLLSVAFAFIPIDTHFVPLLNSTVHIKVYLKFT